MAKPKMALETIRECAKDIVRRVIPTHAEVFRDGYLIIVTQQEISMEIGWGIAYVNAAMKELYDEGVLTLIAKGVYFVPAEVLR